MFNIKLVDIGGDGMLAECTMDVDTLVEAEIIARNAIIDKMNTLDVQLIYEDELVYDVFSDGRSIGTLAIESL